MDKLLKELMAAFSDRQQALSDEPITGESLSARGENFISRDIIRAVFQNYENK